MGKIDTSGWKKKKIDTMEWREFHLYDIFSISMGNKFDRSKMCEVDEGINFVGRSALTNGVACAVTSVEDKKGNKVQPYPAGDITIALGGSIGAAFVQDREFYTSQNVCVLHTDDPSITERVKWFVAASITASCGNYEAFTDELNRHIRTDFTIRLPVDKTGQPDWAYMESFTANLEIKVAESLTLLQAAKDAEKKKVDTREWGSFALGALFNIVKGKRLTKAEMKSGETPFIGSSALNNGCTAMIGNDKNQHPENTITVCYNGSVGETFYQDQPYIASDDVNVLYPKFTMNRQIALFIVPLIKGVSSRYDYIDKWKKEAMEVDKIYLPVDKNGDPDWDYMEEYMKMVQEKTENVLNQFVLA